MSVTIAIDMGTSYTTVYKQGEGLVLFEPTVAAVKENGNESFFGSEAKKLIGKTSENISIIFPIFEGVIVNLKAASELLKYFKSKITEKSFFPQRIKLLMTTPCGLNTQDKLNYEKAATNAGFKEVYLLDCPIACAVGISEHMDNYTPIFLADIGGGVTDIAVVNMSGIITGSSLAIGGNNVDTGIIEFLINEHGIKTGLLSAEKVKTEIGSLYPNDNTSMMIGGREAGGNPTSMLVTSKNINGIIEYYYQKILDVAEETLKSLPPEISADVMERGIFLCGGGSSVLGIDRFFYKTLKIPVSIVNEPIYTCITGLSKIITDKKMFEKYTGLEK
ncbi:MAG: rod shape-determining protein [Clostridia bacterium]|nr:rod shape-determining protein [Clostridia bacterium]